MANHIKYPVVDGKKKCGSCGKMKPIEEYHKARRHYVSACKPCRSKYFAEYRQTPAAKSAGLAYSRKYRSNPINRRRLNEKTRAWRKKPESKAKRNAARRLWSANEKQRAVDYKGGKCVCCGYHKCLAAMDFHHKNPSTKDGYGSGALKSHWTFERNRPELDKCELVCVRCHREIHAGMRSL